MSMVSVIGILTYRSFISNAINLCFVLILSLVRSCARVVEVIIVWWLSRFKCCCKILLSLLAALYKGAFLLLSPVWLDYLLYAVSVVLLVWVAWDFFVLGVWFALCWRLGCIVLRFLWSVFGICRQGFLEWLEICCLSGICLLFVVVLFVHDNQSFSFVGLCDHCIILFDLVVYVFCYICLSFLHSVAAAESVTQLLKFLVR